MTRRLIYVVTAVAGIVTMASNLRGDELLYHSNTYISNETVSNPATAAPAVKFDLPIASQAYDLTSFGVLSRGISSGVLLSTYPANTEIAIRVCDSSGHPIYTSSPFDVSGQDSTVAMRYYNLPDVVQVSNSFYAGFQEVNGGSHFGYLVDSPSGNQFKRSFTFSLSSGTKFTATDDYWFNAVVVLATPGWTGIAGANWADTGNWSGAVPGAIVGTTNSDTASFNQNATNSPLAIDAGRNVQNITFDTANVNTLTVGAIGGNPLLLTSGGTIQTTSTVVNPQAINAPLVVEGNYTFTSGASSSSATLSFGGGISPAAANGTTTLTLNGSNSGANTASGILADNGSGRLAVTASGSGVWILTGANTYSGDTTVLGGMLKFNIASGAPTIAAGVTATVASGATLELAGSVSALGIAAGNRVHVVNSSTAAGVVVSGINQIVGAIDGSGNTQVNAGAQLTANHIRQSALVIGGTAGSHAVVTIDASDSSGNPLDAARGGPLGETSAEPSGLLLAGSLASSGPFGSGGISSVSSISSLGGADPGVLPAVNATGNGNPASVPEPSTLALMFFACVSIFVQCIARRRRGLYDYLQHARLGSQSRDDRGLPSWHF